jgi:hypothetical protein
MSYSLQINIFSPKKSPLTAYFKQKTDYKNHTLEKLKKSIKQELIMQKKTKISERSRQPKGVIKKTRF